MKRRLVLAAMVVCVVTLYLIGPAWAQTTSLTIDRTAQLSPGRTLVTVTGTVTCTLGEPAFLNVNVIQDGVNASGFQDLVCSGSSQAWQITAQTFSGVFHSGRASATASSFTVDGTQKVTDATIQLR